MRISVALALASLGALAASPAYAQAAGEGRETPASKPTRRSDFTLGTSGGFGLGRASGYPNEVQKIGDGQYRSNTKLGLGSGGAVWLGVAFNDYLTFGLGMGGLNLSGNDRDASAAAFIFHIDAFPLFDVHESLRDLGAFAHVGTGPLQIKGGEEEADGGLMAYVEGGLVYERLRFWRVGIGPSVSLIHMWSESARLTGALIGGRVAFYSGP
jgi:hypothetical protein